jgi:beta-glucoside operon transcriptional antiterminator
MITENDSGLFEQIAQLYPKALTVSFTVKDYIEILNESKVTKEEVAYLTVHINRLMSNKKLSEN